MLTHKRLLEVLHYNSEDGIFTWKIALSNSNKVGDRAGRVGKSRNILISIDKKSYLAHRLAWFYVKGVMPSQWIDHKDLDWQNNRIENLREANPSQNNANCRKRKNNTTGFKCVCFDGGRFKAYIRIDGKVKNLGRFASASEAHAQYAKAALALYGEFARLE